MARNCKAIKLALALREARLNVGMTLREVEKTCGVSNAYLCQLESGVIAEPSPHKLFALAKTYGVPYRMLFLAAGYRLP